MDVLVNCEITPDHWRNLSAESWVKPNPGVKWASISFWYSDTTFGEEQNRALQSMHIASQAQQSITYKNTAKI